MILGSVNYPRFALDAEQYQQGEEREDGAGGWRGGGKGCRVLVSEWKIEKKRKEGGIERREKRSGGGWVCCTLPPRLGWRYLTTDIWGEREGRRGCSSVEVRRIRHVRWSSIRTVDWLTVWLRLH